MNLKIEQKITLRQALIEDERFLFDLYASTRAEELDAWGWDDVQRQAFLALQFRGQQAHYDGYPNQDHQIVIEDGRPIGRLFVSRLENEIRLVDITLMPEFRGQGIGGRLIRGLIDEAQRTGKAVRLHVEKHNQAQRLYRRLGFEVFGDAETHWLMMWRDQYKTGG